MSHIRRSDEDEFGTLSALKSFFRSAIFLGCLRWISPLQVLPEHLVLRVVAYHDASPPVLEPG